MKPLVEIKDLTKIYKLGETEQRALKSVSLEIYSGDFLAFAGSSGSGKTTLLNLVGALDHPTSGKILVEGRVLSTLSNRELSQFRRENLGFIFQSFNLFPVLTALENVEYPLRKNSRFQKSDHKDRALLCLKKVGLEAHAHKLPSQMSGGQRQRVSIARALCTEPRLIIADEPTASLDRANARSILDLMKSLNEVDKVTFIFSTHDPEIIKIAKRVIHLSDGEIISATKATI